MTFGTRKPLPKTGLRRKKVSKSCSIIPGLFMTTAYLKLIFP